MLKSLSPTLVVLSALCLAFLAACGATPVGNGNASQDVATGDLAQDATPTAADTVAVTDTLAVADSAEIAEKQDAAPVENDVEAAPDVKKDGVDKEKLCNGYNAAFEKAVTTITACYKDSDCGYQLPTSLKCGCPAFVNQAAPDRPVASQAITDFNGHQCDQGFCGDTKCPDVFLKIGACPEGKCVPIATTCDDLQKRWAKLIDETKLCTGNVECQGQTYQMLGCDCMIPASTKLIADDVPTGIYANLLQLRWTDLKCPAPVCPDCAKNTGAACLTGKCGYK